jgi:hypothetical protein
MLLAIATHGVEHAFLRLDLYGCPEQQVLAAAGYWLLVTGTG